MALIKCSECGREISDKAQSCPGCGVPVNLTISENIEIPTRVKYDLASGTFNGTKILMIKLAMRAIQELGWKLCDCNETLGLVTFETSISWGSWSGVSCSLNIEEVSEYTFKVTGTGKQNIRGGQMLALNIGNEAQSKANNAIDKMKKLAY